MIDLAPGIFPNKLATRSLRANLMLHSRTESAPEIAVAGTLVVGYGNLERRL